MADSDQFKYFEAILKTNDTKKPLALYNAEEKYTTNLSSNILKPQDVITTVSKQLKEIQKADCSKKEFVRKIIKRTQSDFVPINVLYSQEGLFHHVPKFETQCVTDTQLIHIADNVEAMVNIDVGMSQDFQANTDHQIGNLKKNTSQEINIVSFCSKDDNIIKESNFRVDSKDFRQSYNLKDGPYVDEINTDICNEFDTSYSRTHNDNISMKNTKKYLSVHHCYTNRSKSVVDTIENFAGHVHKDDNNIDIYKDAKKQLEQNNDNSCNNIRTKSDIFSENNDNTNKEVSSQLTNIFVNKFYTDSNMVKEEDSVAEKKELSGSLIFKSSKPIVKSTRLSPLIFPLESFEKFESLAMPFMQKNVDFETAKCVINSQIMDNQLLISADAVPIITKPADNLISEVYYCNKQILENIPTIGHNVETSVEPKQIVNKSTRFDDEILFSSDEENDYFHYCSEDLPTTCALETSFSESEVDLDETVFVGFQTSSDKCIQVSKNSFIKAKYMLDSIDKEKNDNLTLTELLDMYDSNVPHFNNNLPSKQVSDKGEESKKVSGNNNFIKDVLKTATIEKKNTQVLEKTEFMGFKTANGKSILISDNALLKCNSVFKDIEENIGGTIDHVSESNLIAKKREFKRFKTASNKRIKILEESLTKASNMFDDHDLILSNNSLDPVFKVKNANQEVIQVGGQNTPKCCNFLDKNKFDINDDDMNIIDQTLLQEFENESIDETNNNDNKVNCNEFRALVDFKKPETEIKNSCTALKYNNNSFHSKEPVNDSKLNENFDPGISDYRTVTNIPQQRDTPKFFGFKTANNKPIKVSREALAKTKDLFDDIRFEDLSTHERNSDITFGCNIKEYDPRIGKSVTKSENINKYSSTKLVSTSNVNQPQSELPLPVMQTANNKVVNISKKALLDTKNIYRDIDSIGINKNEDLTVSNIPQLLDTPKYFGFKTANNKEIKVSSEALAKTKDLFHNIGFEDLSNHEKNSDKTFGCNFEEYEKLASKCYVYQSENESSPAFQGFRTASNKVVNISKDALLNTKNIFHDIDSIGICEDNLSTKYIGHSNDSVEILTKNKKIHNSISVQGLKTISNKPEDVFVKAVTESRKNSQDMINDTAGVIFDIKCKEVTSPIMLRNKEKLTYRSNKSIHDVVNSVQKLEKVSNLNTDLRFQGFKTANNMPVIISEESLLKSRKVFENIDDIGNNNNDDVFYVSDKYVNLKNGCTDNIVTHKSLDIPRYEMESNNEDAILEDASTMVEYAFKDVDCETNTFREVENVDYSKTAMNSFAKNFSEVNNDKGKKELQRFNGFQTASNKCVKISDEAIARSRKIFDEFDFDVQNDKDLFKRDICFNKENINKENVEVVLGLNTDPEESLKKSKQLVFDFRNDIKETNKQCDDLKVNTIDTQLLNNFEETLHTEDFYKDTTPKQCKRSGSPILSCPKAKKRKKFETPYRTDTSIANIQKVVSRTNKKSDVKYVFSQNYKKTKLHSLKELDKSNENKAAAVVDPYILNFYFDTLLKFEFEGSRNDFTNVKWTTDTIKTCFVESVDSKIIPEGWLDNHIKLILWKLISYEIRFPDAMRGVCSVTNILEQLKYRYDKELYCAERPALRKILEKDDISTRTMILAVVGVYVNGVKVHSVTNTSPTVELLVTDGWYCVKASTDRMITRLVSDGKIAVGRKIATIGAELLNCEQGISPWEDTSAVRLKIFGNSTRPARWDARLGFHANGSIFTKLSTIDPSGGKVCKTRAVVLRVYPALYVEKLEDGSTVTRSERLEHLHQIKYETEREIQMEKLYEEVEKEYFDQESSGSEGTDVDLKKNNHSGSQLNRLMKKSNDPSQFRSYLTESQAQLLAEYTSKTKEKVVEELQKRVQDKIRAQGLHLGRNVISLLKIRVAGLDDADDVKVSKAMISIWRPNDAILDVVKEGAWIDLFNVIPTGVRNSEIQISAGRQSVFHRSKYKENDKMKPYIKSLERKCFTTKDLNKNSTYTNFNEIDTVGAVFLVEPSLHDFERIKGQQFQNVYLTDVDKNFICINFWGGIKKFGYENIFDTGSVVACMNLQKRAGNIRKSIPQYRAMELTVFTKTPKLDHVRNMVDELIRKFSGLDKRKFCDDCVLLKNNSTTIKHKAEFSPYRFNTSDYSLNKNKIFIDSPLVQNKDVNLNLTGLDFESPFQQVDTQELSPAVLKRKQVVKDKIAKLKMYGEPPPLSKIHIVNKSKNAGSAFKSPLTNNVARDKILDNSPLTTNKLIQPSPVLSLNRTFVVRTGVNPVKLNFSTTSEGDDKIECNPFEEEFEASPPLSLD